MPLWIAHAGVCCGLRCFASVDYGPVGPVDYAPAVLWITGLTALWIREKWGVFCPTRCVNEPACDSRKRMAASRWHVVSRGAVFFHSGEGRMTLVTGKVFLLRVGCGVEGDLLLFR